MKGSRIKVVSAKLNEYLHMSEVEVYFTNSQRIGNDKHATLEVNLHPPFEYNFWICLKCTNDFQTVTTMPF